MLVSQLMMVGPLGLPLKQSVSGFNTIAAPGRNQREKFTLPRKPYSSLTVGGLGKYTTAVVNTVYRQWKNLPAVSLTPVNSVVDTGVNILLPVGLIANEVLLRRRGSKRSIMLK
jgi:hypothetical protein